MVNEKRDGVNERGAAAPAAPHPPSTIHLQLVAPPTQ